MEKTHPFVCLEPWYGVCDSKDFTGELKRQTGSPELKCMGNLGKRLQYQDRVICLNYNRVLIKKCPLDTQNVFSKIFS